MQVNFAGVPLDKLNADTPIHITLSSCEAANLCVMVAHFVNNEMHDLHKRYIDRHIPLPVEAVDSVNAFREALCNAYVLFTASSSYSKDGRRADILEFFRKGLSAMDVRIENITSQYVEGNFNA